MASDMRLNDKPIAKDGAYIYAEAADGSQVKISKADLASVVAEQIAATGINVLYQSINPKDFNLATETGIYGCGGASAENGPTASPYGTLIVLNSTAFGGGYSIQMFIGRSSTPSFYYRVIGGAWMSVV